MWFIWPILSTTLGWGKTLCLTSSLLTPTFYFAESQPEWAAEAARDGCLPSTIGELPVVGTWLACWRGCSVRRMYSPRVLLQQEVCVSVNTPVPCPSQLILLQHVTSGPGTHSRLVGGHSPMVCKLPTHLTSQNSAALQGITLSLLADWWAPLLEIHTIWFIVLSLFSLVL